jgi:hypothetical protein
MRPIRLLLALSTSLLAVLLLALVTLGSHHDEQFEQNSTAGKQGGFKALFAFTSPGSLFPPSAMISLTDDNSTFFLARPAAFGPTLPKDGLSSPLWIGSGFGDDAMGRGELGCGDSPEWDNHHHVLKAGMRPAVNGKVHEELDAVADDATTSGTPDVSHSLGDGTDDHLRASSAEHTSGSAYRKQTTEHSDIKSLQESAEIDGKVVLLKRGGCGFLAKVLWAQKRGAVAVIVGDDVRGGELIRMYAKGDTSNVTISSLFTSHTTAQLLSSLLPGAIVQGLLPGKSLLSGAGKGNSDSKALDNAGKSTSAYSPPKVVSTPRPKKHDPQTQSDDNRPWKGWLDAMLFSLGIGTESEGTFKTGSRRPPASGGLHGLEVEDWSDDQKPINTRSAIAKPTTTPAMAGFTIGKQDWRDPDVLSVTAPTVRGQTMASSSPVATKTAGGVLPGSGEYPHATMTDTERKAWWSKWFGPRDDDASTSNAKQTKARSITSITDANLEDVKTTSDDSAVHEGLWVTLTPTNVSSSPFFDTLLVLVVSPLVTLTVVYALLLLRSRIRRRRWRAPKSLVERLPVRTYQTISDSSSSATPHAASPTTPLLQHSPTHSQTDSMSIAQLRGLESDDEEAATSSTLQDQTRTREEEKRETGLAEWRRRYGGRQKECVVCLDEYVDGVSQVMSLPCGHEFHAECM